MIPPKGEKEIANKVGISELVTVDRYKGKVHIDWDENASVTPNGQMPFLSCLLSFVHFGLRYAYALAYVRVYHL